MPGGCVASRVNATAAPGPNQQCYTGPRVRQRAVAARSLHNRAAPHPHELSMTLRSRLALGLVILAAVLVVPLFVARSALLRLHGQVRSLREGEFQASLVLGRLRDAMGDVRAREVALGIVRSDTVHRELITALGKAEALADSLDRHELDGAAQSIRADLTQVRAAAEDEYRAMRAGRSALADSISQTRVTPALHNVDLALAPAEL